MSTRSQSFSLTSGHSKLQEIVNGPVKTSSIEMVTGSLTQLSADGSFNPATFINLLTDTSLQKPLELITEKDTLRIFEAVTTGLAKSEDWTIRINALNTLQGLSLADNVDPDVLCFQLKSFHELICAQILDLRSTVCKEACRTIACIAIQMGPQFSSLVEIFVPVMLKQVIVKIQIMSQSADKAIRIITASSSIGFSKVIPIYVENCIGKNPILRRQCFEYLSLACALWKFESLEKHLSLLKQALRSGINDADQNTRKAARILFCIMRQRQQWKSPMESFLGELESPQQKLIQSEVNKSCVDLVDLIALHKFNLSLSASKSVAKLYFDANRDSVDATSLRHSTMPVEALKDGKHSSIAKQSPKISDHVDPDYSHYHVKSSIEDSMTKNPPSHLHTPHLIQTNAIDTSKFNRRSSLSGPVRISSAPQVHESVTSSSITVTDKEYSEAIDIICQQQQQLSSSSINTRSGSRRMSINPDGINIGQNSNNLKGPQRLAVTLPHNASSTNPIAVKSLGDGARRVVRPISTANGGETRDSGMKGTGILESKATRILLTSAKSDSSKEKENILRGMPSMLSDVDAGQMSKAVPVHISISAEPEMQSTSNMISIPKAATVIEALEISSQPNHSTQLSLNFTNETLKQMAQDPRWDIRLKAFDYMNSRLKLGLDPLAQQLSSSQFEVYLDIAVLHLEDAHQKVATVSMSVIAQCIQHYAGQTGSKLSVFLPALFLRLADRRLHIRDQANELLNCTRRFYDPTSIVAALSTKIVDIPDRIRIAVLQYLGVTVPHCEPYFLQPQNTWALLGRLAHILGGSGSTKPSPVLISAGKRLLELIYKAAPPTVCSQIAALSLVQQSVLKRLLEQSVPEIEHLVVAASKAEWAIKASKVASINSQPSSKVRPLTQDSSVNDQLNVIVEHGSSHSILSSIEKNVSETLCIHSDHHIMSTTSPHKISYAPANMCLPEENIILSPVMLPLEPSTANLPKPPSPPNVTPQLKNYTPVNTTSCRTPINIDTVQDIVWLLSSLRPIACMTDKILASKEVRRLAKCEGRLFWAENCAQIISVLLESFNQVSFVTAIQDCSINTINCYNTKNVPLTGFSPVGAMQADSEEASKLHDSFSRYIESMHLACKSLLAIVKYQGEDVKNVIDLVVTRLSQAAAFAPVAVSLHCEQILTDLANLNPIKVLHLLIPFARGIADESESRASTFPTVSKVISSADIEQNSRVKLLSLHVMPAAIRNLTSGKLLIELPSLVDIVLASMSSPLADIRKAVILLLVEAYLVIGDALYPFVQNLAPPQKKLLTIYIDKQVKGGSGI